VFWLSLFEGGFQMPFVFGIQEVLLNSDFLD